MHRLLKRQLRYIYGRDFDYGQLLDREKQLLETISLTYADNDQERKHYEHILEVNSKELNDKNRDIKKALTTLSEAQRLAHVGSWLLDLGNNQLEWSDELYRIFELEPQKATPSSELFYELIHPDDKELADPDLQYTHQFGAFDNIYRLKFNSDKFKYVHEHREILYDHQSNPVAVQGTLQDVTDHKKAEEELHLYANVFKNSGESILITNKDKEIIAVNSAFTENTGYTIADLKGQNPRVLSDGSTPAEVYEDMWSNLSEKGFWQGELRDRKKNGECYPKWMSISVSYSDTGEILHYIASFTDISDRKAAQERIHYLAHHDALTGLINRFSLEERLSQAIHTSQRNNENIALMFIDMDRFKIINDTMGHPAGDELLIEVANRITSSIRECDIAARIGGDEFVIVITGITDTASIPYLARFLVHKLAIPYIIEEQEVFSSPSIGISLFPEDGMTVDQLLKNADSAMYHAKEQGRNNYQFFTESLNKDADKRLKLEKDLRQAIDNGELELFYQPQICSTNDDICGVEALLRWRHPEQGLIPPDKFIPIAEESKLIEPIGLWVLEEACRQQSIWKRTYQKKIKMSVNISAQQLQSRFLISKLKSLIDEYQLAEGELELEVTESTAMENPKQAILRLDEIRKLGIILAIDDFGTGYSSLSYLKLLPIHTLKLDKSFVSDLESNSDDAAISAAALALAHNLGLTVVAEGVETKEQKDFLISHDCEILQGFYFSRPVPADEITVLLQKPKH